MEAESLLIKIGLSCNEAKIYLALLKLGPSLVSKIEEETGLNRTHIYDRLKKLLEKGRVSYTIQAGKRYFQATNPKKLLEDTQQQERDLKKILPSLLSLQKTADDIRIEVYKGKEGLKSILQDCLKERQEIFILGFTGSVAKVLTYFYPQFQKRRSKLGIKRKILADFTMKKSLLLQEKLTEYRIIPPQYSNPSGMWIYGDKTIIFLPEQGLYMIFVKSKRVATLYKNYFDLVWKLSSKNTK